jgi:hypothetical protein
VASSSKTNAEPSSPAPSWPRIVPRLIFHPEKDLTFRRNFNGNPLLAVLVDQLKLSYSDLFERLLIAVAKAKAAVPAIRNNQEAVFVLISLNVFCSEF